MAELVLTCPHCDAERMGFTFAGEHVERNPNTGTETWNTLFVCRKCQKGVVVRLRNLQVGGRSPGGCSGDPRDEEFDLIDVYPKPQPVDAPEHVPEDIAQDYKEAMDSLRRQKFTSAGMMLGRVLEQATMQLAPPDQAEFARLRLEKRIDSLADLQLLTPAMREWAHLIRLDRNFAVHDADPVDEPTARQMQSFTELFLLYAFTLPARVEKARRKTDAS